MKTKNRKAQKMFGKKKMFEDYKHYLEASRKQNKPFRKNKLDIDRLIY